MLSGVWGDHNPKMMVAGGQLQKKEVVSSIILIPYQSLFPLRGCPNNGVHLNHMGFVSLVRRD